MRFLPRSILGQFLTLLVVVVVLLQATTLIVLTLQHRIIVRKATYNLFAERTSAIYLLLGETPKYLHPQLLGAASTRIARFSVTSKPLVVANQSDEMANTIRKNLQTYLGSEIQIFIQVEVDDDDRFEHHGRSRSSHKGRTFRRWGNRALREGRRWAVSIALPRDQWLNLKARSRPAGLWAQPLIMSLVGVITVALLAGYFLARRITGPLSSLRNAAERLGRGEMVEAVPEKGPQDVRQVISSFNEMQDRLTGFVVDRTRMLAAISHDLRTPITSLRLRAEFIDDADLRNKVSETLDEMERMIGATLSFAKEEAANEETKAVDLAGLLQSLAGDMSDMGEDVTYKGLDRYTYPCRHHILLRALRNITENATRYGERARLHLSLDADGPKIIIEDDGPGIPESHLEYVFEPFVRLETSRNTETGGIGLGLAIARTIIRAHGGEIFMANRKEGGLRVVIELPEEE